MCYEYDGEVEYQPDERQITRKYLREHYPNLGFDNPKNFNTNYERPSKDAYFLAKAQLAAARSHDSQTQCGCVFVKDGRVVSEGYNGFLEGGPDHLIPNTRPEKYKFIMHSERNAIMNAAREGISLKGATAYITGPPCPECAKHMIACGIKDWRYGNNHHSSSKEEEELLNFFIDVYNVKVTLL